MQTMMSVFNLDFLRGVPKLFLNFEIDRDFVKWANAHNVKLTLNAPMQGMDNESYNPAQNLRGVYVVVVVTAAVVIVKAVQIVVFKFIPKTQPQHEGGKVVNFLTPQEEIDYTSDDEEIGKDS